MKILVTGGLGWTANAIVQALVDDGHEMTLLDLDGILAQEDSDKGQIVRGDVSNFQDTLKVSSGMDVIVHLAVAVGPGAYDSPDVPFSVNVQGAYNVLEAARRSKIKQVLLLSSAPVHIADKIEHQLGATDRISSRGEDHLYDLTKRLQEEIAEDFSNTFGMSVLVLRVGHIVDGRQSVDPTGRPLEELEYCRGFWVCRYDVADACLHGVKKHLTGFNCYHIIGGVEGNKYFDLWRTEEEFGFIPSETFERFGV